MKYTNYRYIYPCRPANAISPEDLNYWDNGSMLAQLKMNGSNCLIFTNGEIVKAMNRHNQVLTNFQISKDEVIQNLYKPLNLKGKWLVVNGEQLNKSQLDERGTTFNHKLILFDILVYDSEYLVGQTFEERVNLLDGIYGQNGSNKDYLWGVSDNIYRVKSHNTGFKSLFDTFTKIPIVEGLVMKRKNAKLELATTEKNNWRSQLKCRKPTKVYKY